MKFKKGFTLVELLVVIAIIGILSAVTLVYLTSGKTKARIASAQRTMQTINSALSECFYGDIIPLPNINVPSTPDSINGGGGFVCSNNALVSVRYLSLPAGWVYCDDVGGGTCPVPSIRGTSSTGTTYWIGAQGDSKRIWCTINGCTTSSI